MGATPKITVSHHETQGELQYRLRINLVPFRGYLRAATEQRKWVVGAKPDNSCIELAHVMLASVAAEEILLISGRTIQFINSDIAHCLEGRS